MTFQQLTYVVEVAKHESINKAAGQLYTHQSNVSMLIKQLEDELGIQLFNRTKRGVFLTNEGREFLSYAQDIVDRMSFVNDMYSRRSDYRQEVVYVSSMRAFFLSVPAVSLHREVLDQNDNSHTYFRLEKRSFYDVIDDVATQHSEVGVLFLPKTKKRRIHRIAGAKNLEYYELGESQMSVVARAGHPAMTSGRLDNITDYPYVISEETENFRDFYDESSESVNTLFRNPPKIVISVNESAAAQDIVAESDGFFLSCTPWQHSEHYDFASLPLPGEDNILCHYYIVRKNHSLSPLAQKYIDGLQNMFRQL